MERVVGFIGTPISHGLLAVKLLTGALRFVAGLFFLTACTHRPPIVTQETPAQTANASAVSAAIAQAAKDNARQPNGPARQAVALLLRIASAGLPLPATADIARMADISALVWAGKLPEAESRASDIERELAALREQIAKERAESAAKIKELIANHQRELDHAAYMAVVWTFCALGFCVTAVGIGLIVWTTWKRAGALLVIIGPIVGGSGLLWGKPWFYVSAGVAVLLAGVAMGIKWAVSVLDRDGNGKVDFLEKKTA